MASAAQIAANRANAQMSTGPRTVEGKAAVARNRTTHGLSSRDFFLLSGEDPEEFEALLAAYREEHLPDGPTESFLVNELAHCQWKLRRVASIEAGLLGAGQTGSSPAQLMEDGLAGQGLLLKLGRYESRIRRDWYRALSELRALRRDTAWAVMADARHREAEAAAEFNQLIQEIDQPVFPRAAPAGPPPSPLAPASPEPPAAPASPDCNSKPIAAAQPSAPMPGVPGPRGSEPRVTPPAYPGAASPKPPYR
jgi:hypothetical protein